MWNFLTHFIAFGFGMTMGVVLMCLLQAGKMADEEMAMLLEKKKQEEKGEKKVQKIPSGMMTAESLRNKGKDSIYWGDEYVESVGKENYIE